VSPGDGLPAPEDDSPERERMKIREVNQVSLDEIAGYMNDKIREQVHAELALCTLDELLTRYLQLDCELINLLLSEFNIEID
jgi:hypothetical protein